MRVLVVAGEASGDAHAAKVVRHLREHGARIVAVGGAELERAGATLVRHLDDIAVLGFVEVLARLPRFLGLERELVALLASGDVDLFLPVDFPGLNLRLARAARRNGVPVLYYIGPQVWAWGGARLRRMRRSLDHVALVLPFEKPLYDAAGVPATFVGHPLLDDPEPDEREPEVDLGLFPGSRPQEVVRHLPLLLGAAARARRGRKLRVLVSAAPTSPRAWMRKTLLASGFDPESELTGEPARRSMARSRALLVASGTATLEAALVGRPFAVLYRTGRVNYALARRLVRVRHIALVNLVAGEDVVREYIQEAAHPEALEREIARLLGDAGERARQVERLAQVRSRLGEPGASRRVAELALAVAAGPRAGAGVP